eukprot:2017204-Rhodomonas_salina.1
MFAVTMLSRDQTLPQRTSNLIRKSACKSPTTCVSLHDLVCAESWYELTLTFLGHNGSIVVKISHKSSTTKTQSYPPRLRICRSFH